jgi:quinol-cytochrome oxidoreductase complex cytochrome b subunit
LCLVIQVVSGIFLAMHYTPHVDLAFLSVEHIMRDVQYGWFIRYIHANGACFFLLSMFICFVGYIMVHLHTLKKFYELLVLLPFLIMILTAFMGYVFTKKRGLQIHAKILDKKPNKNLLDQKRFMSIEGNLKFFNIKKFS